MMNQGIFHFYKVLNDLFIVNFRYLVVNNVPAYGNIDILVSMFSEIGEIEEYRLLDEENTDPHTDIYWFKYKEISFARIAKRKYHKTSFLGNIIYVRYAPEYENVEDLRLKINDRLKSVTQRLMINSGINKYEIETILKENEEYLNWDDVYQSYSFWDIMPCDSLEFSDVSNDNSIPYPPEDGEIVPFPPLNE